MYRAFTCRMDYGWDRFLAELFFDIFGDNPRACRVRAGSRLFGDPHADHNYLRVGMELPVLFDIAIPDVLHYL